MQIASDDHLIKHRKSFSEPVDTLRRNNEDCLAVIVQLKTAQRRDTLERKD
jgi:hypothetical protein